MYRRLLRGIAVLSKTEKISFSLPKYCSTLAEKEELPLDHPKNKANDKRLHTSVLKAEIDQRAQQKIDQHLAENPEAEKLMKILMLEVDVLRQDGEKVPSELRSRDIWELLICKGRSARRKLLEYLWTNEMREERRKEQSKEVLEDLEKARKKRLETPLYDYEKDGMRYDFSSNFLLRKIMQTDMNRHWNWNVLQATMLDCSHIVLDMNYERHMSPREIKSCSRQLMSCYANNRMHKYPFQMHFCGVDFQGPLMEYLYRLLPNIYDSTFPIDMTEKSYLDYFPKEKLVYLTPHCDETFEKYDPNLIYIIGAFVDKSKNGPISLARAKQQGLRMKRLPLEKHIRFGDGSCKNLPINQVLSVMLDIQREDWSTVLKRHLPSRKLQDARVKALENRVKREMFYNSTPLEYPQVKELPQDFFNDFKKDLDLKRRQRNEQKMEKKDEEGFNIDFSHGTMLQPKSTKWSKM